MKAKIAVVAVIMLMVSTIVVRAEKDSYKSVSELALVVKKSLDAPSEMKESYSSGTVYIVFNVNDDQKLEVTRVWSYDLSKNDLREVEMMLLQMEDLGLKYVGSEKQIPVKVSFRVR